MKYEDSALLRCVDTGDSEIVSVHELVPRVQLTLNLWPGTKNYKRLTLQWVSEDVGYSAEIWGRQFTSRGPKVHKERNGRI